MSNDSQTAAAERLQETAVTLNNAAQEILKAALRAKTESVREVAESKRPTVSENVSF